MYCSTPLSLGGGSSGMYFEFSRQKAVVSPPSTTWSGTAPRQPPEGEGDAA